MENLQNSFVWTKSPCVIFALGFILIQRQEKTDKKPTLYSLRHTSIMMRLINGNVNTLALARNARTSQAMIDKFYAAHLTTNQVREQLHGFTGKKTPVKNTSKKNIKTDSNTTRLSSKTVRNATTSEDTK